MPASSRRRTITLRDGARVTLRPIAPEDAPLVAASFERLSKESRYRRLLTHKETLSEDELAYLVNVDHQNHEAIIAIEPSSGDALGVARYIRSEADHEVAELAVTVADDWQRRGLGRALLARLAYRARREGVRKFSAFVMTENPGAVKLLAVRRRAAVAPGRPGDGADRRVAAPARHGGTGRQGAPRGGCRKRRPGQDARQPHRGRRRVDPAHTLLPPRPIRTIVVGADDSATGGKALAVALGLGAMLGTALHVVSAYGVFRASTEAEAILEAATQSASAQGLQAVTHARRDHPAEALIAVAEEQDADLVVVGDAGMSGGSRFVLGSVPDRVSHHAPCSVLIVRTG